MTFGWVAVLGALAGTVLGIAVSALPGSAQRRSPPASPPSRSCCSSSPASSSLFPELPGWMQQVAALFPLKWLTQGMRSAFLPEQAGVGRARRQLGARQDRPGACRMGDHRRHGVRADVPLAAGRGMSSPSLVRSAVVLPVRGGRRRTAAVRRAAGGSPSSACTSSSPCSSAIAAVDAVVAGVDGARQARAARRARRARRWRTWSSAARRSPAATTGGRRSTCVVLVAVVGVLGVGAARAAVPAVPGAIRRSGSWCRSLRAGIGWTLALARWRARSARSCTWTQGDRAAVGTCADARRPGRSASRWASG